MSEKHFDIFDDETAPEYRICDRCEKLTTDTVWTPGEGVRCGSCIGL